MAQVLTERIKGKIIGKAMQDEAFRQQLFANPAQAVADSFGVNIPQGKTLHVLEQTPENLNFVVLLKPAEITEKMTENEIIDRLTRDMPKLSDTLSKRMNVYGKILAKSWTDPQFLDQFTADPKTVINAQSDTPLIENQNITIVVEDDQNEYLVLPALGTDAELTDEELELVSGGTPLLFSIIAFVLMNLW